jgi:hypothetical protein
VRDIGRRAPLLEALAIATAGVSGTLIGGAPALVQDLPPTTYPPCDSRAPIIEVDDVFRQRAPRDWSQQCQSDDGRSQS